MPRMIVCLSLIIQGKGTPLWLVNPLEFKREDNFKSDLKLHIHILGKMVASENHLNDNIKCNFYAIVILF